MRRISKKTKMKCYFKFKRRKSTFIKLRCCGGLSSLDLTFAMKQASYGSFKESNFSVEKKDLDCFEY